MTLYLKYRPQTLEELDLVVVRESLSKILKSGRIPHAFLFSGPRGTGKTSAARVLAKVVNCTKRKANSIKPCNKCDQCLTISKGVNVDVVELDAASHRGIDDIRTLREAVKLAPAKAKKKVYIIDEAHMLTVEASNALLKTLEEPPDHVMFILATTNPEKLIGTIRSRTTQIFFNKASEKEIIRSLEKKVKGEKLKIDEDSLILVAKASDGSFRDADKILEQIIGEKILLKPKSIEEYLKGYGVFDVTDLLGLLVKKEAKKALKWIEDGVSQGVAPKLLAESILRSLRESLLGMQGIGKDPLGLFNQKELLVLIKLFSRAGVEIPTALIEQLPLELAVVEWCQREERKSKSEVKGFGEKGDGGRDKETQTSEGPQEKKTASHMSPSTGDNSKLSNREREEITKELWARILAGVRAVNTSTEALLRATRPLSFDGKTLVLGVYYRFHKEHLESLNHRRLLEGVATNTLGSQTRVICQLSEPPAVSSKVKGRQTVRQLPGSSQVRDFSTNPESEGEVNSDSVLTESHDEDIIKVAEKIFSS